MEQSIRESQNPLNKKARDEFSEEIYKAGVIYYNFLQSDKDKIQKDNIFIISKEFIDSFKAKIKYDENINLFKKGGDDSYEKFYKFLTNYSINELESIVFSPITIYGDLDDLEDDIDKGFEFVTKDFLEKLEVKLIDEINDINFEDYKVKYIKDGNNIIIIFDDESKLIICNDNNGTQYHAIPAPVISVKSSEKKTFRKANTICIKGRRDKIVITRRPVA